MPNPKIGINQRVGKYTIKEIIKFDSESELFRGEDKSGQSFLIELLPGKISPSNLKLIKGLFDVGVRSRKQSYFVSPYASGTVLADKLLQKEVCFSEKESLHFIKQLAVELKNGHDVGLVHPDLRPENIWISTENQLTLLGWESERLHSVESTRTHLEYVSPEEQQGQSSSEKSNIYSLGVLLYRLIAGHRPKLLMVDWDIFDEQALVQMEALEAVCPDLTHKTVQIVRTCLRQQAWGRYDDIDQFIIDVDSALTVMESGVVQKPAQEKIKSGLFDNRKVQYATMVVLGLVVLIALFFVFREGGREVNTAVSPLESTAVPVQFHDDELLVTETAVSPSSSSTIQINNVEPIANTKFARSDTVNFSWNWPRPLADKQQFVVSIYQNDELRASTVVEESKNGMQYQWEIPIAEFAKGLGEYHWQIELQLDGIDVNIRETLLTSFEILPNTPTPTQTNTPTLMPSPTKRPTRIVVPSMTPTPVCVPTRPVGWVLYTIKANDVLFNLATQVGTTADRLQEVNCLDATSLSVGKTILLPLLPVTNTPISSPQPTVPSGAPPNPPPQPPSPSAPPTLTPPPVP